MTRRWAVSRGEVSIHLMTAARVGPAVCGAGQRKFIAKTAREDQVTCSNCRRVVAASKAAAAALPPLRRGS